MTDDKQYSLHLRALEPEDADFMYDIENDTSLWFYSDRIAPLSRRALLDYALSYDADPFRAGQLRLIVDIKENGSVSPCAILDLYEIDHANKRAFVGYVVAPGYRGRGVAKRSLALLAQYCEKHLGLTELAARTPMDNSAGVAVLLNVGFRFEAVLKEWLTYEGRRVDLAIMRLKMKN